MKRILIVDDHSAIRMGVKYLLEKEFGNILSDEASNTAQALNKMHEKA